MKCSPNDSFDLRWVLIKPFFAVFLFETELKMATRYSGIREFIIMKPDNGPQMCIIRLVLGYAFVLVWPQLCC